MLRYPWWHSLPCANSTQGGCKLHLPTMSPDHCDQGTQKRGETGLRRDSSFPHCWSSLEAAVASHPVSALAHAGEHSGGFPQPHHSPHQAFSLAKEPLLPFPSLLPLRGLGGSGPGQNNAAGPRLRAAPSLSQPFAKWEIRGRVTYFLCSQGASVLAKQGGEDSAALPGLCVPVGCCGDGGGR